MLIVIGILGAAALFTWFELSRKGAIQEQEVPEPDANVPPKAPLPDVLNVTEIFELAKTAGFRGGDLRIAVAIALAESGGKVTAYNPEIQAKTPQGKGSYGLWQIYLKVHPEFAAWNLFDPAQNAMAAYKVYLAAGKSFYPWSTYGSNAMAAYLPQVDRELTA